MNPLELTYDQLLEQFQTRYGRGTFHAAALYRAFFHSGRFTLRDVPAFSSSPRLAAQVQGELNYRRPRVIRTVHQEGVTKLALAMVDGQIVETVIIPMPQHTTVCISCQAGCRMGCRLCETGRGGLRRSLSAAEIVAQVHAVTAGLGVNVRNVVFMGMGEPLDNLEAVVQAIRVISDQRGLNIAKRRITVSTCGLTDGIHRLAALGWPQLKLAVSLNAADDATRSALMPVNRRHNLASLKQALRAYPLAKGNVLLVEYVLIKGVNDSAEDARRVACYLEGLPVRLNLIPYNPGSTSTYETPSEEEVRCFHQRLIDHKIFVRRRRSKGSGIRAACGQLGGNGAFA